MIKKISFLFAGVLILASTAFAANQLSFSDVADNLNAAKKTDLYVKTYWQEITGQEVYWIGKVVNVKGGKGKADVFIADKDKPLYKGYNIVIETFDMEGAGKLEIGQTLKFKGVLNNYKAKRGNPVIVYLTQGEFN